MIATLLAALLAVVNSAYSPPSYACDGVTAVYTVNFPYQSQGDLVVTSTTAGGAVTTLVLTTDYSLNVSSTSSTATLTLANPAVKCPSGSTLKIARSMALTQPTSFRSQTSFNPATHELAYDRLAMEIQQVNTTAFAGVTLSAPLTGNGLTTPIACPTATSSQSGCLSNSDWTTFNNKSSNGVSLSSSNSWTAAQLFANGLVSAPSISFINEAASGLYRAATNDFRMAINGNDGWQVTPTGFFLNTQGVSGTLWRVPNFYEMTTFFPGKMVNAQTLARLAFTTPTVIEAGLPGAKGYCGAATTGSTTVTLNKRTAAGAVTGIGTLVWNAAANNVSTVTFSSQVSFAAGDFIEFIGPGTADATMSDVSISFQVRRQ